jgi:hypothetical protein
VAVLVGNSDIADTAVQTPLISHVASYLRRSVQAGTAAAYEAEAGSLAAEAQRLRRLRLRYSMRCLEQLGEYMDALGPVLQEQGVEVCLEVLRRWAGEPRLVGDALGYTAALMAHRKFADLLVDAGGAQLLLAMPR